jgi:hypothetical protein
VLHESTTDEVALWAGPDPTKLPEECEQNSSESRLALRQRDNKIKEPSFPGLTHYGLVIIYKVGTSTALVIPVCLYEYSVHGAGCL